MKMRNRQRTNNFFFVFSLLICVVLSVIAIMGIHQSIPVAEVDNDDYHHHQDETDVKSNQEKSIFNHGGIKKNIDAEENGNDDKNNYKISNHDKKSLSIRSKNNIQMTLEEFINVNNRLSIIVANNSDDKTIKKCACGCYRSRIKSCPKLYTVKDVIQSSNVFLSKEIIDYMDVELMNMKKKSQKVCDLIDRSNNESIIQNDHTESGGYCLNQKSTYRSRNKITYPSTKIDVLLPQGHVNAPEYLVKALEKFITKEQQGENGLASLSDFGAGIGQYGARLEALFPDTLIYKGYDGAGDVEDYTQGYLTFFDLTIPLNLPVTDWILCLEVGEHVPHYSEGMMIRNLHAHNCKGVILSWGVEGQGGENHVNLHNNEYLIEVFKELGYIYDVDETNQLRDAIPEGRVNGYWFRNTLMVFRRSHPIC